MSAPAATAASSSATSTADTQMGMCVMARAAATREGRAAMSTWVAPPAAAARTTARTLSASKLRRPAMICANVACDVRWGWGSGRKREKKGIGKGVA